MADIKTVKVLVVGHAKDGQWIEVEADNSGRPKSGTMQIDDAFSSGMPGIATYRIHEMCIEGQVGSAWVAMLATVKKPLSYAMAVFSTNAMAIRSNLG